VNASTKPATNENPIATVNIPDETAQIGDSPLELQPKLLRALQEQEFERLGSGQTIRVDARVVAATNQDLSKLVAIKLGIEARRPHWSRSVQPTGDGHADRLDAVDPDRKIAQFYHTAWTVEDGAPSGIHRLAQTKDGYMWLGTRHARPRRLDRRQKSTP